MISLLITRMLFALAVLVVIGHSVVTVTIDSSTVQNVTKRVNGLVHGCSLDAAFKTQQATQADVMRNVIKPRSWRVSTVCDDGVDVSQKQMMCLTTPQVWSS
jgi:hypothetical protein